MDVLQAMAGAAVFPNGYQQPSVTGRVVSIGQGWPLAADVDKAIAANHTIVSIYAIPSTTAALDTPFDWNPGLISGPVHGITAAATDAGFTLAGAPTVGAYVTAIVDGQVFTVTAATGDTSAGMAIGLAKAIAAAGLLATASGSDVNLFENHSLTVRVGAPARVGRISHRQRQNFQITVWAPTPSDRTAVARAIDVALKRNNTFALPDTSTAVCVGAGTNIDDKREQTSGFHRALIFAIQWDTLDDYPAWEITSVNLGVQANGLTATAVE